MGIFKYRQSLLEKPLLLGLLALAAMGAIQFTLGISTLLLAVPIGLAVAHQLGAFILLQLSLVILHRL